MELKDVAALAGLVGVLIGILTFAYTRFQVQNNIENKLNQIEGKDLAQDVALKRVEEDIHGLFLFQDQLRAELPKIQLFWDFVRENFPKLLVHEKAMERDILLMRLSDNTITDDGLLNLKAMLENEFEHMSPGERKGTEALINRLNVLVIKELIINRGISDGEK